jgi:hypothetical protein
MMSMTVIQIKKTSFLGSQIQNLFLVVARSSKDNSGINTGFSAILNKFFEIKPGTVE